jgi:drug/metabolite transporter (DMT)-like permease
MLPIRLSGTACALISRRDTKFDSPRASLDMNTILLGIIAAFCWGFHDICVRFLSQKTSLSACIFTVLTTGLVFHLALMGVTGGFGPLTSAAMGWSLGAGAFYVMATFGLYFAFQRGPVRLVAPLIAGYPILSVGLAAATGTTVTPLQWAAVAAIVIGVGIVAMLADDSSGAVPPKGRTILYSVIAALGFAGTFALGQHAAGLSGEMPTTLVMRALAVGLTVLILVAFKLPFWPGRSALPLLIAMGVADGIALLAVVSAGPLPNPQYAAVTASMFGLLTIVLAWVFLKERMSLWQWSGCIVAFCGVGYLAI